MSSRNAITYWEFILSFHFFIQRKWLKKRKKRFQKFRQIKVTLIISVKRNEFRLFDSKDSKKMLTN